MKWTFDLFDELQNLEMSIEALENNYYDTHDLDEISKDEIEIRNRISYLQNKLPLKNTSSGDYLWNFENNKLIKINN